MLHQTDDTPSISRQSAFQAGCSQLTRLKGVLRHPSDSIDHYHQYAIYTVIRHLFIAWGHTTVTSAAAPLLHIQHKILLTYHGQLRRPETLISALVVCCWLWSTDCIFLIDNHSGIRLARLYKIRAGPRAAV